MELFFLVLNILPCKNLNLVECTFNSASLSNIEYGHINDCQYFKS